MVRPSYALNREVTSAIPPEQPFGNGTAIFHRIPIFSLTPGKRPNLNGFRALPPKCAVDWAFFFPGLATDGPAPRGAVLPQPSYKLDTTLVDPLTSFPGRQDQPVDRRALAALNLLRGWRLELPSGQAVARRMGLDPIPEKQIFATKERARILKDYPGVFDDNAPLWFYILREAEFFEESKHLGPVGGTIVAEVLAGLIQEDRHSFLSQWPKWTPTLPGARVDDFTMADLVNFTNR